MAPKGNRKRARDETKREEKRENLLKKKQKMLAFRGNAFLIIHEMVKLNAQHPTILLDEILHSIFFLGKLNDPEFSPDCLASNPEDVTLLEQLRTVFPRPFVLYTSHLPKRSPFSCVLDMIVNLYGQNNDDIEIIKGLQDFISNLKLDESMDLVSSTICVSQSDVKKYYGVSMSTSGCYPGRIMIAASCLSSWDPYVADAVMTYYPNKSKKPYFDGTIKLPPDVTCKAFNIRPGSGKLPCRSCENMFGLKPSDTKESDYGNCAEAESLSNLLKCVGKVREGVQQADVGTCTDENRVRVKESVLTELERLLREMKFKWAKEKSFYDPSV